MKNILFILLLCYLISCLHPKSLFTYGYSIFDIWYRKSRDKLSSRIPRKYATFLRSILMRLYSPFDLTGNVNMIEKLVLGGTGTGDLPILSPTR